MNALPTPAMNRTGIRKSLPGAIILFATILLFTIPTTTTAGPTTVRTQHLTLAEGAATTVKGELYGCESVSYIFSARAGQRLQVRLSANNEENYLNVYPPGKGPGDEALRAGSVSDNSFDGSLPASGDYTISVYLLKSAARKNESARYTLNITLADGDKTLKP